MSLRVFSFFILFFVSGCFLAQDVIVQKNGNRIFCRILSEDSLNIYYSMPNRRTQFEIKKTNVYKYERKLKQKTIKSVQTSSIDTSEHKEFSETLLLSFLVGVANPLSDFASQDVNSDKSGLAKTGFLFNGSVTLKLSKFFGFSICYRNQSHGFSDELVAKQIAASNPGINFTSSSTDWIIRGVYGGIHLSSPVENVEHLSFDCDLFIGRPTHYLPQLIITGSSRGQSASIIQDVSETKAVSYMGTIGIKYRFNKNLAFNCSASYLQSKAKFSSIYIHASNGASTYTDYEQEIKTLTIQIGFSFLVF